MEYIGTKHHVNEKNSPLVTSKQAYLVLTSPLDGKAGLIAGANFLPKLSATKIFYPSGETNYSYFNLGSQNGSRWT